MRIIGLSLLPPLFLFGCMENARVPIYSGTNDDGSGSRAFCELDDPLRIVDRKNIQKIQTLEGRTDETHRKWWFDIAAAPTCAFIGFCLFWYVETAHDDGPEGYWDKTHLDPDTQAERDQTFQDLRLACSDWLVENHPEDILRSEGDLLISNHYFCGEPYIVGHATQPEKYEREDGNRYYVDILYSDPIFESAGSSEDVNVRKCNRLKGCAAKAVTAYQVEWVKTEDQRLGCNSEATHLLRADYR